MLDDSNLTTSQYVAEEGSSCPLTAAVAVGNPFNLEVSSKALLRTFIGKEVYQRVMGSKPAPYPYSVGTQPTDHAI